MLAASCLLSFTACKKKSDGNSKKQYVSGQEIKETDPFFNSTVNELVIPTDKTKEVEGKNINYTETVGKYMICSYSVTYVQPEWMKNTPYENMSMEMLMEAANYFGEGTAVFDMEGKIIRQIDGEVTNLYGAASDKDDNLYIMGTDYDMMTGEQYFVVQVLDSEGKRQESIKISEDPVKAAMPDASNPDELKREFQEEVSQGPVDPFSKSPSNRKLKLMILNDGALLVSTKGYMIIYNRDGSKRCEVKDHDRKLAENAFLNGNKYYVLSTYTDEKGRNVQVKELNIQTGVLGQGKESLVLSEYSDPRITEAGIFINSLNGCYQYDPDTDSIKEVFNWNDSDINRALITSVRCQPESADELNAVAYDSRYNGPYLIHLTRAEKNPHAGKKIIRIGGMHLNGDIDLMTFINQYNADPNGKARAIVTDYTEDRDAYENNSAETERKIYMDILAGDGPDILVNMGDSEMFRNGRIMEDLNSYLDGEKGIDRTKYFDNIFRACESDGHLYHVPISFSLKGMVINADLISNRKGWTYEEFAKAEEALPEDVNIIPSTVYNDLLKLALGSALPKYMNYQDQTVNFQNDEMKKILEFVRKYGMMEIPPNEKDGVDIQYFGEEKYSVSVVDYTEERLKEGLIASKDIEVFSAYSLAFQKNDIPGKTGFVGYPSLTGTGMSISPQSTLGILSSGKYKDLAWDVIRAYLEYTEGSSGKEESSDGISVNRERFETQNRQEMAYRNKLHEDNIIEIAALSSYFAEVKEEDIDDLRTLVENADNVFLQDPAAFNVISEEAAGFFAGDRTAEDVLSIIQNRTKTIVSEG